MKIYIANDKDTLRKISQKTVIPLEQLISVNPNIGDSDADLSGRHIYLPDDLAKYNLNQSEVPMCPEHPLFPKDLTEEGSWIPLTPIEKMEQTDYDVLIVGTGAGGGAALWRLAEQLGNSRKRIGIVERGGLLLPTHIWNISTMTGEQFDPYVSRISNYLSLGYPSPQIYALGGRTLCWLAASPRMPDSIIATWPVSTKEMSFYYKLAEKAMSVTQDYTKGAPFTQILLNRLQSNGIPEAIDQPAALNLTPTSNGVIRSNVFFSSLVLLAQAMNHPFDLAINARVVEVLTEKNRAVGVKVMSPNKKSYVIHAKNLILSASTFGSAQILLNSNIQSSAIGHYLTSHSRVNAVGVLKRSEFPENLGPLQILVPGTVNRSYQIQIWGNTWVQYEIKPLTQHLDIGFYASGAVESRYDNKVTLDPLKRDAYGVPELQIDFTYSMQDEINIQKMALGIREAAAAMKVPLISQGGAPIICKQLPGLEIHEMGTCRMGDNPLTSATNRYGQIHGVQGLYVADNSVIPISGTANPTLTTVALAFRTSDYIVSQLK